MTFHAYLAGVLIAVLACRARAQAGTLIAGNMNDNTATLIDASTGRVVATLATGEGPHEVAASHDGRWALVSNYGVRGKPGSTITVIDVAAAAVARTIDLKEYQRPHGMAFLPGDTIVAVTCEVSRAILLVDFRSGTVVRTLPTNGRTSHMLSLSANGERMVVANISDNAIAVVSVAGGDPKTIPVARQPEGIAIAPDGNTAWVGSNRDSVVLVVDLRSAAVADTIRGFGLPYRMAISRDGKRAVVTDPAKATVRVFDAVTRRERFSVAIPRDSIVATAEVPGSPSPEGIALSPDGRWAFVTLQGRNRLVIIDLESGKIVRWAVTGAWSDGVAYSPVTRR